MQNKVTITTRHGISYEFKLYKALDELPQEGGIYLISLYEFPTKYDIIYVGLTYNLKHRIRDHEKQSWWLHVGPKQILFLKSDSDSERKILEKKFIDQFKPRFGQR